MPPHKLMAGACMNTHVEQGSFQFVKLSMACLVQVLPGARIPTDGEVLEGVSYMDESMLTGESGRDNLKDLFRAPLPCARRLAKQRFRRCACFASWSSTAAMAP